MRIELEAPEVENAINDIIDNDWYDIRWYATRNKLDEVSIEGIKFPFELIEFNDGGETEWQYDIFVVFKVGNQAFKKSGIYRSHDGTEWEPLVEVHAVEKTITVWETK